MIISLPATHFAEGYFTIDVLSRLLSCTLLDPVLTFLPILHNLQRLTSILTSKTALHALKLAERTYWFRDVWSDKWMMASLALCGLGVWIKVNQELSRAARNNFTGSMEGWEEWKGRVVVITGGKPFFSLLFLFCFCFALSWRKNGLLC